LSTLVGFGCRVNRQFIRNERLTASTPRLARVKVPQPENFPIGFGSRPGCTPGHEISSLATAARSAGCGNSQTGGDYRRATGLSPAREQQFESTVAAAPHLVNLSAGMDAPGITAVECGFRILFPASGFREDNAPVVTGENARRRYFLVTPHIPCPRLWSIIRDVHRYVVLPQ
jgi:hypothetical protein